MFKLLVYKVLQEKNIKLKEAVIQLESCLCQILDLLAICFAKKFYKYLGAVTR